ncbi:hypothetical protein [Ochrobactrum sp. CGA5]|uniref:hypothetical protein n=1 Tax=Ochrobactrum sp. CGA5 TaxID=2583453 RepID=UPI00112248AA|nr:hypothetical protein [Ochrobactrum sp. CGA5]
MEQFIELYSQLPLEAKIGYGVVGIIVIAMIIAVPFVVYCSIRLPILAAAWAINKFKSKPDDDDDTPAAV